MASSASTAKTKEDGRQSVLISFVTHSRRCFFLPATISQRTPLRPSRQTATTCVELRFIYTAHHVRQRKRWQGPRQVSVYRSLGCSYGLVAFRLAAPLHSPMLGCVLIINVFTFIRGGAKRHRKILRDNIQGITKPVRTNLYHFRSQST